MDHEQAKSSVEMQACHCRAARALLNWTIADLAKRAGLSADTVHRFESEKPGSRESTRRVIRQVLEGEGFEFYNGQEPGVRIRLSIKKATSQSG